MTEVAYAIAPSSRMAGADNQEAIRKRVEKEMKKEKRKKKKKKSKAKAKRDCDLFLS